MDYFTETTGESIMDYVVKGGGEFIGGGLFGESFLPLYAYIIVVVLVLVVFMLWYDGRFNRWVPQTIKSNDDSRTMLGQVLKDSSAAVGSTVGWALGLEKSEFVGAYARSDDMKDCRVFDKSGNVIFNRCGYA